MNSFGHILRLTTFGESHGPAMGGILDGMPPRVYIDMERVRDMLARRRPGHVAKESQHISARREKDIPEILSGISPDGLTLGTPIGFIIRNTDAHSNDYAGYVGKLRPNHADYTYHAKYGIQDWNGGGRASARETVCRTVAGAIVMEWLRTFGISIHAVAEPGGDLEEAALQGDTLGGFVSCIIKGLPAGIGEPVFDKLHSSLASAVMSINAAKAFEYGDGMALSTSKGSETMDLFREGLPSDGPCITNHSGGVQGGISNGMPVNFKVYFKPTPTLMRQIESVDISGNPVVIPPRGRHDVCVALRAAPIVEAMAALTVGDLMLQYKARQLH